MRAKGLGSILDCVVRFAADFALAAGPSHDRGSDRAGQAASLTWCQFCDSGIPTSPL